jgi:acyl-CoA synthetase (AMP-forming)/AMP-acid ligase II
MNVASLLTRSARRHPDRPALGNSKGILTYRRFDERVAHLAGHFQAQSLRPGDRVGLLMRNRLELLETLFACFRVGLTAVPINARLHPNEAQFILQHSGAALTVYDEHHREHVSVQQRGSRLLLGDEYEAAMESARALPDLDLPPDHLAWLFYTSGTTGRPKGAMLSHDNLMRMIINCLANVTDYRSDDIVLHPAPLTHGCGLYSLASVARASLGLVSTTPHFEPASILRAIAERGVTVISFLAPTMLLALLNEAERSSADTSSLRNIVFGGAPIYAEDLRRSLARFGPILTQIYGQGESPMTITHLSSSDLLADAERFTSAGRPHDDVELRIVDDEDRPLATGSTGEVCARGAVVMLGYWNDPEVSLRSLRGGWLHTGDVGRLDESGYLYLLDRKNDLIISGGSNIYPREVEEVLLEHPSVQEATVIGIPDHFWGEAVHAFIVLKPGQAASADDLVAFCRSRMASYKKPKSIEFVKALPRNAYGKIMRRELREPYWKDESRRI